MAKETKKSSRVYSLKCLWDGCLQTFQLCEHEYHEFSRHVENHVNEKHKDDDEHSCLPNKDITSPFICRWNGCPSPTMKCYYSLLRHVLLHSYHTKLKTAGEIEQQKQLSNYCELDNANKHLIPDTFNIDKPWICHWSNCADKEFMCPNSFYRHVDDHTLQCNLMYDDHTGKQTGVMCEWKECQSVVKSKHKLREHCRVHTQEKVISCPNCGSFFANNTKFLDHVTRQNVEAYENYQCSHCLKRCASERLLRDHMRHHVNHLKCPECDMTCPNPSSLREHMKYRHTDERPFKCDQCSYCFKGAADLQRHNETHLKKIYSCSQDGCQFTTRTVQSIKRHVKERHENSIAARFACHICGRRYTRGTGLTSHLKTKHNFKWPSGFPRFRYREYEDGLYRLQMVRFESAELTQRLAHSSTEAASKELTNDYNCNNDEKDSNEQLTTDQTRKIITDHLGGFSSGPDGLPEDDLVVVHSGGSLYVLPAGAETALTDQHEAMKNESGTGQLHLNLQDEHCTAATAVLPNEVPDLENVEDQVSTLPNQASFITISPSKFAAIENNFENVNVTQSANNSPNADILSKDQLQRRQRKRPPKSKSKHANKRATLPSEYDQRLDISQTLLALQESASNI